MREGMSRGDEFYSNDFFIVLIALGFIVLTIIFLILQIRYWIFGEKKEEIVPPPINLPTPKPKVYTMPEIRQLVLQELLLIKPELDIKYCLNTMEEYKLEKLVGLYDKLVADRIKDERTRQMIKDSIG